MQDRREKESELSQGLTGAGTGPEGVDKAPGEETSAKPYQFVQQTQKGKNKVDGDPSQENDRPIEQS